MRWFWQSLAVLGAVAMLGLVSVSAGDPAAVTIKTFQFTPTPLEVKAGTRVIWTNEDDIGHTVTSGSPESRDSRFDSRLDGKGASSSVTFTQPGTYDYFCNRHQSMRGQVRVN
jgi:plastocyanin